jgi:dTDP-4-dehydrorhamnose 3,5-epimerase
MKILKTNIPEVLIFSIDVYRDNRGHFLESYNYKNYKKYLSDVSFVQDNESTSKKGVLRGLHYQESPKSQAKLIRVIKGRIQDVAVDIRKDSPTFKQYVSIELNENNHHQLFIPSGFAHGFLVLSDEAVIQYKVNNNYEPSLDRGYRYDDPSFNIKWMLDDKKIILSEKDKELPFLK